MADLKFPRRRMDDQGNWIVEEPPSDPESDRQFAIARCRDTLDAKHPDGSPAYTAEARARAADRLKELEGGNG